MTIFTIGYEGLTIDQFKNLLIENAVQTLVDVRELPLSRKRGFSKKGLAHALEQSGIAYVHMPELGCPRPIRNQYREDRDWQRYTEGFMEHLETQGAAVESLATLGNGSSCALMCFEADYNRCHRSMVANAVHERSGASISHIDVTRA